MLNDTLSDSSNEFRNRIGMVNMISISFNSKSYCHHNINIKHRHKTEITL